MTLASVSDIRGHFNIDSNIATSTDITNALNRAERKLYTKCRDISFKERYSGASLTFYLDFKPVNSIIRVYVNSTDETITEGATDDDYSKDLAEGTITLGSDAISDGQILFVDYIPKIYKDLEMLYAVKNLMMMGFIQTGEGTSKIDKEFINNEIETSEEIIEQIPYSKGVATLGSGARATRGGSHKRW